jgi:hypothetical protein
MIKAKITTDDGINIEFDVTKWFEKASLEQIKTLDEDKWSATSAEDIAEYVREKQDKLNKVLLYIQLCSELKGQTVGYEITIDKTSAVQYLRRFRFPKKKKGTEGFPSVPVPT